MSEHKPQEDGGAKASRTSEQVPPPERKPELESDVHPQRRVGEAPLPDESDNIPGDENQPNLVRSRG
ncbi:hypothetical protein H0484_04175 [Pusillimonas sp. CC-YST705]|uniref:Uncharacterized protein n=1 Tax=Mesopusillimonas faecipullorum TaxID=2755040 RepID=A0ABS8CAD2_9BURK|nr:hypothetical protein [Mesopusillimonas faecipullorum]MCB5362953.1 hypothetical protein [Mesopusillimonas faecipullorum]